MPSLCKISQRKVQERRQRDEIVGMRVPVSSDFKLILVRPVEQSVATRLPYEHGQESCVHDAPLASFSRIPL